MYSPLDDFLSESDYYYERPVVGYPASRLNDMRESAMKLQLLNRQVSKLEEIIRKQGAALSEKDAGHKILQSQLRELNIMKERQIRELSNTVRSLEKQNRDLDQAVKEKNEHLEVCQRRLNTLDKFLSSSIPSFERLLANFKSFAINNDSGLNNSVNGDANGESKEQTIASFSS